MNILPVHGLIFKSLVSILSFIHLVHSIIIMCILWPDMNSVFWDKYCCVSGKTVRTEEIWGKASVHAISFFFVMLTKELICIPHLHICTFLLCTGIIHLTIWAINKNLTRKTTDIILYKTTTLTEASQSPTYSNLSFYNNISNLRRFHLHYHLGQYKTLLWVVVISIAG